MELIIGFIFIGAFIKMLRRAGQAARSKPRRASYTPPPPVKAAPKPKASAATLAALDDARQTLQQQLDIVQSILDSAPPEKQRIQLLRQQSTIYNQLANIESKIHKAKN